MRGEEWMQAAIFIGKHGKDSPLHIVAVTLKIPGTH